MIQYAKRQAHRNHSSTGNHNCIYKYTGDPRDQSRGITALHIINFIAKDGGRAKYDFAPLEFLCTEMYRMVNLRDQHR